MLAGLPVVYTLLLFVFYYLKDNPPVSKLQVVERMNILNTSDSGPVSSSRSLPVKNIFGQPSMSTECMLKQILWEGTDRKSVFVYDDQKQLVRHIESDGGENVIIHIEYIQGRISKIRGWEATREMNLAYDAEGRVSTIHVLTEAGSKKVLVHYKGDRTVEVEYDDFSITFYFDVNYNLTRAVSKLKDGNNQKLFVEAIVEPVNEYKNFLLSTGDYRFISLLYGDYIGEGAYAAASVNFYRKYTTNDNSTGSVKTSSYDAEVLVADAKKFPTTILYKLNDSRDNYRIHLSYNCP